MTERSEVIYQLSKPMRLRIGAMSATREASC
jgi:hypothetical protein